MHYDGHKRRRNRPTSSSAEEDGSRDALACETDYPCGRVLEKKYMSKYKLYPPYNLRRWWVGCCSWAGVLCGRLYYFLKGHYCRVRRDSEWDFFLESFADCLVSYMYAVAASARDLIPFVVPLSATRRASPAFSKGDGSLVATSEEEGSADRVAAGMVPCARDAHLPDMGTVAATVQARKRHQPAMARGV